VKARVGGFIVDVATGQFISRDLTDRTVERTCQECHQRPGNRRCDFPVKEPHRFACEKRLCEACAVHIFTRNDCDYCAAHAKEAGIQLHPIVRDYAQRARLPRDLIECRNLCGEELREKTREILAATYRTEKEHAARLRA
jgi:hypothetical protein